MPQTQLFRYYFVRPSLPWSAGLPACLCPPSSSFFVFLRLSVSVPVCESEESEMEVHLLTLTLVSPPPPPPLLQSRLHRALVIMDHGLDDASSLAFELRSLKREAEYTNTPPRHSRSRASSPATHTGSRPHTPTPSAATTAAASGAASKLSLGTGPRATSVRDLVSHAAHELGVLFAPKQGRRTTAGLPLYSFGSATLYIDKGVIFARPRAATQFEPISLDDLPGLAQ